MTREHITDEMREAVKRAIWTGGKARTADRLTYEERGPGADEVMTKLADDAIEAVAPMIREQATGGSIVANEEGEFVDCILADVPYVSRVLPGGVPVAAVLLDMQTRKVIGLRVYSAAAIRAMKEQP
jgi:hypothetical protein